MSLTEDDLRHLARTATARTSQAAWELLARLPWSRSSIHDAWLKGWQDGARDTAALFRRDGICFDHLNGIAGTVLTCDLTYGHKGAHTDGNGAHWARIEGDL